jgi:hypothetical protein
MEILRAQCDYEWMKCSKNLIAIFLIIVHLAQAAKISGVLSPI